MQIGMELLVIDWAKEEPKMWQIIRHIFMFIANKSFLSQLCNIFSEINSVEGVLPNDEFLKKKIILPFLKYP